MSPSQFIFFLFKIIKNHKMMMMMMIVVVVVVIIIIIIELGTWQKQAEKGSKYIEESS
jgi:cytochrome oxidase assembly protein ShyY1